MLLHRVTFLDNLNELFNHGEKEEEIKVEDAPITRQKNIYF